MKRFPLEEIHNQPVLRQKGRDYPSISYSEISTYLGCRQRHHWRYRRQLEREIFDPKPVFGSMAHIALEAFYAGLDWNMAVDGWIEGEFKRLQMFDETKEAYQALGEQVKTVITNYVAHYEEPDSRYTVRAVEQKFSAILPGTGRRLEGFWDAVVISDRGHYWLRDYKTSDSFVDDWALDLDLQISLYLWAARRLGILVAGVIFDQIKRRPPKKPELLKSGKELSRAKITTDWPTYEAAVLEHGFDPRDYEDMQVKLAGNEFFRRSFITRTDEELEGYAADVIRTVKEIRRDRPPVLQPSRQDCKRCPFRELCIEGLKGNDVESLIEYNFVPRSRREDHFSLLDLDTEEEGGEYDL